MADEKEQSVLKELWSKLVWLLVLMPGFLALLIATLVAGKSLGDEFQVTIYSVILSCAIIPVAVGVCICLVKFLPGLSLVFALPTVLLLIALCGGVLLGIAIENDWLYRGLRNMPLTQSVNKISDSRPLAVLFRQNDLGKLYERGDARKDKASDAFVIVTTTGGLKFEGWPEIYEITDAETQLFLSPACTITVEAGKPATLSKIPGPGVLVYEREIVTIEFLDRPTSPCYLLWYPQ